MLKTKLLKTIHQTPNHLGEEIKLGGWVYNKRSSGKISFLQFRDGTGFMQCVVSKNDVSEEIWQLAKTITQESSLYITGIVREDSRSDFGYELSVTDLELVQMVEDYPISNKEHGVDFLLDHRHLWLRSKKEQSILRVRAEIVRAIRNYLDGTGFTQVDSPVLTPSSCEGTTNLFGTSYFGTDAYLSQSGQLYMEAAALALGRVYSFGPTFRAEKSKTRRHLIEFWMMEPEMAFVQHDESLQIQEELVRSIVTHVLENCSSQLKILGRDTSKLNSINEPFARITYDEAIDILHEVGFADFTWGDDFGAPHETAIAEHFSGPVFITHYPTKLKSFYMRPDPKRPEVVLCADLIAPEGYGEIIGGSERIFDPVLLEKRYEEHKLPLEAYKWYLDLRRYGTVPHSGFGLGLERTVAWICGLEHIRETIAFPRMLNRFYP